MANALSPRPQKGARETLATVATLRRLAPFEGMRNENLRSVLERARVRALAAGDLLFRQGERDTKSYFLLEGELGLYSQDRRVRTLAAGTAEARAEIAPVKPRKLAVKAEKAASVLVVETELLQSLMQWEKTGSYEVSDLNAEEDGGGDDWMTALLHSSLLQRIPPGNIQALFLRLERRPVATGEVIVRQGDPGDYFYFLVEGEACVRRDSPNGAGPGFELGRLGRGDTFGEESLLSGRERTASVIMTSDGVVMRLPREDFQSLLSEPLLTHVGAAGAREAVAGGARWLDVRMPNEVQAGSRLEGAANIPLFMLRLKYKTLDPAQPLMVVCDDGSRARAAAYLLTERGFDAAVVEGGIAALT